MGQVIVLLLFVSDSNKTNEKWIGRCFCTCRLQIKKKALDGTKAEISGVLVFMYIQCIGAFYPGMLRIKIVRVYALYLKLFKQNCRTNMLYVNLSFNVTLIYFQRIERTGNCRTELSA